MSFNDDPPPLPPPAPQKSGTSTGMACLFGCLGLCAVFVILVIAGGVFTYYTAKSMIDEYTDTEAVALPTVEYTEDEAANIQTRVTAFFAGTQTSDESQTLELTDREINVLLRSRPEAQVFGDDWINVDIEGNELTGEISMPLTQFGLGERYLNASVGLKAAVVNDQLFVTIESASVKGTPVPELYMQQMRGENLAKEFGNDPEMAQYIDRVEEVLIEDDKLKLVLKPAS